MTKKTSSKTTTSKTKNSRAATSTAATKEAAKHRDHKVRLRNASKTFKLVWRHVTCRVRHTPNYISTGWSHIEIMVVKPKGAPIPITGTGYKSHFLDEELLAKGGGPVAFFSRWIEQEATTKQWAKAEYKWRQLELFPR
jgi:hypothetical protein